MFLYLILTLVVLIPLLAIVLDSQVGRALASRLEGRSLSGSGGIDAERLAFLEGEVDRLGREIERLNEEGEFVQKLLTERASGTPTPLPSGDDSR
ncbi:MAG: hypothetical protein OEZ65_05970 [Gemmatimonadota bacterium]|nr:hypothetical protein [Gemmatimonadota bacterium]